MRRSLPAVTSQIPRDLRTFIDRLRDFVSDTSSQSRLLTADELVNAGVIALTNSGTISPATTYFATPPSPSAVSVSAAVETVVITWNRPLYNGHAYAEIWGSSTNDIGTAALLGMAPGSVYTDVLGPSTTRYYWVRFVNVANVAGPYNAVGGIAGTTGSDLAYTMQLLSDAYGGTSQAPFFQIDVPTTIGGVTIPAGTYMKQAFIYDGTITNAKIKDLAADKITTGYIAADRILAGSIDSKIATLDAAVIGTGIIADARIGQLDATHINVSQLDSISANMGTITAGRMQSTDNNFVIDLTNKTISISV